MATDYLIESVSDTQSVTRTYSPAVSLPYSFDLGAYANKCRQFIFYCSAYNPQTGDVEEQLSVNGIITDDGCELLWEHGVTATYYASTSRISIRTIPPYDGWQGRLNRYNLAIVTNDSTLGIVVADQSKTNYDAIPTTIYQYGMYMPVTSLSRCFYGCTNMTVAPVIPSEILDMDYCFYGCTSLTGYIYIYNQQLDSYPDCFYGTRLPITLHAMNNNVDICEQLALTATNNNVYINTTPTTLPSTIECTPMNYMTDNGLVQLSPQTDASLVSVQVPNGSGTITTTLEDVLVDLYQRVGDV